MKVNSSTLKAYVRIGLIVFAVTLAIDLLTLFISYPTQAHIEAAQSMATLDLNASSEESEALFNKPESRYTTTASLIMMLIGLVVYIWTVFFAHFEIRKQRLAKNAVVGTVGVITLTTAVLTGIGMLMSQLYLGNLMPGINSDLGATELIITTTVAVLISAVITFLIALIADRRYEKKHSFIVE